MLTLTVSVLLGTLAPAQGAAQTDAARVGFPEHLALSPDGSLLVFSWAGDLWAASSRGGAANRLTAHPAEERRSAFSPDGSRLAFESDRDGARNLYVMPLLRPDGDEPGAIVAGPITRLTFSDRPHALAGWSADGREVWFSAGMDPSIYRAARMHAVPAAPDADGGAPIRRLADVYGSNPRAMPDASGSFVFSRNRADSDRPAYRGSGSSDIFQRNADGSFSRLTSDPANDFDAFPLADGSIIFISSRTGQNNLYRLGPQEPDSRARALTNFSPTPDQATIGHGIRDLTVSANGKVAAFVLWDTVHILPLDVPDAAARPIALSAAADRNALDFERLNLDREVSEAALSPDGKTLAVIARGEVFVRSSGESRPTRRVTSTPGRERDLAWSPDGQRLYFASDDPGQYELRYATVTLTREDLGDGKGVSEAATSANSDAKTESKPSEARKAVDHGKRWAESLRYEVRTLARDSAGEALTSPLPSPDGKLLLATRGRGNLVLIDPIDPDQTPRELLRSWNPPEALWASDSRHLIYSVEDLDFNRDIWLMDTGAPTPADSAVNLTRHPDNDAYPRLTADGKLLYFVSERAGANNEYDVFAVWLDREMEGMTTYETEEYFKKAAEAAGKRKPLGSAPAKEDTRKDEPGPEAKDAENKDGEDKDETKKDEPKKSDQKKTEPAAPLRFDAADAYLRVRRLTSLPGAESDLAITPGGDRVLFTAMIDGERSLMSVDHKGGDRKTLQAGNVSNVTVSLTGDKAVFIRTGTVSTVPPKGGKVEALPIDAPVTIDVAAQQRQKFLEAARIIGERFYHPTLKGRDWPALTRRYLSLAEQTRSSDAFNRVLQMLFGELDASHTGASGGNRFSAPSPRTGYLGCETEPVPGGHRVTRVIDGSPAAVGKSRLSVGDVIIAIDGVRLAPDETSMPTHDLATAMLGKAGKETLIEVRSPSPAMNPADPEASPVAADVAAEFRSRYVLLVPIAWSAWDNLSYEDEVQRRRARVDELSGGTLGYLHIRGMGGPQVLDFERDLFAAASGKRGLIIDVRDNGGGWTTDILLASLTAPRHAWTAPRGVDPADVPPDAYPRDRRLIYAWTRPMSVLINQNSFSNAEIFAHAIKTTQRGRIVGTPTFGGVISTGSASLIDGTSIRVPGRGWYLPDGTDMENNGCVPDLLIPQTPEDEAAGVDRQLEEAVRELLGRVG